MSETKQTKQKVKIIAIPCFQFISTDGTIERLDFIPVDNVPGFSHRVAYNGNLTQKFLGAEFAPNKRNALDMLDLVHTWIAAKGGR